jgi:hypothetical protein
MNEKSNIVSCLHHLNMAKQHIESFILDYPNSKGASLFKTYLNKINWCLNDFKTSPLFSENLRMAIKKEIECDAFAVPAIVEKISLLTPEVRENIEELIDEILKGGELKVERNN